MSRTRITILRYSVRATTSTLCVMLTEEMRDTTLYCLYMLGGYLLVGMVSRGNANVRSGIERA